MVEVEGQARDRPSGASAYVILTTTNVSPQGLIRSLRSTPVIVTLSPGRRRLLAAPVKA